ncbi:MAG TPA: hypothetical protein VFM05_07225, partial [Candidatus Saccharimonadales bacterium]|nr:hypothetical protein [Candidatus Saccharimonadales bacterium]
LQATTYAHPFEFGVVTGVLVEARRVLRNKRHKRSLAAGKEYIRHDRKGADQFEDRWQQKRAGTLRDAPMREYPTDRKPSYKPIKRSKVAKEAGRYGYKAELRRLTCALLPPNREPASHVLPGPKSLGGSKQPVLFGIWPQLVPVIRYEFLRFTLILDQVTKFL